MCSWKMQEKHLRVCLVDCSVVVLLSQCLLLPPLSSHFTSSS